MTQKPCTEAVVFLSEYPKVVQITNQWLSETRMMCYSYYILFFVIDSKQLKRL